MAFLNRKKSNRGREPTAPTPGSILKMVTVYGDNFYSWDGKLYSSDIVRACIRPKVKAAGKLVGKHIRDDPEGGLSVNPKPYIARLLRFPNPLMTGQQFQEKMAAQLCLNNNAFALVVRDVNGLPEQLYPVPAVSAESILGRDGTQYLRFTYRNGKSGTFLYSDIIHLRQDFCTDEVFGSSPAPALSQLMECVGIIDQGVVRAIKNSGVIRWLLKFPSSLRKEDVRANVKEFVDSYLSYESETLGAAGVDSKAEAEQIKPMDYVPNAAQTDRITERIYSFFNTNKKIVQSAWSEDEWNAYYEAEVEPFAIQLGEAISMRLFSGRETGCGNRIVYEASNLQCASLSTKLNFQAMVDRGAMTPNEWRAAMNMAPIEGGDKPVRRLDTQVVDAARLCIRQMNAENCMEIAAVVAKLLEAAKGGDGYGKPQD